MSILTRISTLFRREECDTITVKRSEFYAYANHVHRYINLCVPNIDLDNRMMVMNRATGETLDVQSLTLLYKLLEHEILHRIINDTVGAEATEALDKPVKGECLEWILLKEAVCA